MAEIKFKEGDIVSPVLDNRIKMIVVSVEGYEDSEFNCRFYNPVTGIFNYQSFKEFELSAYQK
jgi:hypothetical protein